MPERARLRPITALAAYAESLLEGRRVIVFGDSSSDIAEQLLERGARLVHVYDPDPTRVAEAATRNTSRNVSYGPLGEGGLAVREGAFDLALVENLGIHDDIPYLLKRVKRCLSARGAAFIATSNPDTTEGADDRPGYYELYDNVSAHFDEVRMLGQTPFMGYAVVDFAPEGEPDVSVDTGFVPGGSEEPEAFIALASERELKLDEYAIVQMPAAELVQPTEGISVELLRDAEDRERTAREQIATLEGTVDNLRSANEELKLELEQLNAPADSSAQDAADRLQAELDRRNKWIDQLDARAATADARADELTLELEEQRRANEKLKPELEQLRRDNAKLEKQLEAAREQPAPEPAPAAAAPAVDDERVKELEEQLESLRQTNDELARSKRDLVAEKRDLEKSQRKLEADLARSQQRDSKLEQELEDASAAVDLARDLEARLRERAQHVRELERQLKVGERLGLQLLRDVRAGASRSAAASNGGSSNGSGSDDLRQKLDRLSQLNAEREADLEAARWSIQELELRLKDNAPARDATLHERLSEAQAELQRQATLIAQLQNRPDPA